MCPQDPSRMSILVYASSMTEWHGASTAHCILSSRRSSLLILKTKVSCYADRKCPQPFMAGKVDGTPATNLLLPTDALYALRVEADMIKLGKYMFSSCKVRWSAPLWLVTNKYCERFSAKRQPSQDLLPSTCMCLITVSFKRQTRVLRIHFRGLDGTTSSTCTLL